jgi:replicative DNA helicase
MGRDPDLDDLPTPVPTGLIWLDDALGGGLPQGLTVLAATSGAGKTSLALQLALSAAKAAARAGAGPVLFFALDMDQEEFWIRASLASGVLSETDIVRVQHGEHPPSLEQARLDLLALPLKLIPFESGDRAQLEEIVGASDPAPSLVVVDPLGLLNPGPGGQDAGSAQTDNLRALAQLAVGQELAILVVAGTNRPFAGARPPALPALPNSLNERASLIFLLARPMSPEISTPGGEPATLFVAKNLNGPTAELSLRWYGQQMRFEPEESQGRSG